MSTEKRTRREIELEQQISEMNARIEDMKAQAYLDGRMSNHEKIVLLQWSVTHWSNYAKQLQAQLDDVTKELEEVKHPKCHCRHCDPEGVDAILYMAESEDEDE